jgi:hypothetical protein
MTTDPPTAANPRIVTCDPVPGFAPQIGRYVAQLTEVRQDLLNEVAGLTAAQLEWHPDDQTESIGTLLLHLDGVEWSWMHEDIFGAAADEYPGRWPEAMPIRAGAPQVMGRPPAAYLEPLARTRGDADHLAGLHRRRPEPPGGRGRAAARPRAAQRALHH